MPNNNPLAIPFYHITEINNLPSILNSRGLYSDYESNRNNIKYIIIGYNHIKEHRKNKKISEFYPYTVSHFVPFYFTVRSPMLYVIHKKQDLLSYQNGQSSIVYLVSRLQHLVDNNAYWLFTDRNAADSLASFYNNINDLDKVDWAAVTENNWQLPEIKARKQAEVLVYRYFPWQFVDELVVYNENMRQQVLSIMNNYPELIKPVRVERSWYYD